MFSEIGAYCPFGGREGRKNRLSPCKVPVVTVSVVLTSGSACPSTSLIAVKIRRNLESGIGPEGWSPDIWLRLDTCSVPQADR